MDADKRETFANLDDLIKQMELDDLTDELADSPYVTPVNYAKLHNGKVSAQNVYYHIRAGHLQTRICPCGRKCIIREEADELFRKAGRIK